jgi:hypothetical protein
MCTHPFEDQALIQEKLAEEEAQDKRLFFQHVLLVSSSIFGILISLHSNSSAPLRIRLVFLLAEVFLALGILTCAVVFHDASYIKGRLRREHYKSVGNAIKEGRCPNGEIIVVNYRKRTIVCEKISLVSFVLSIVLLCTYAILTSGIGAIDVKQIATDIIKYVTQI